MQMRIGQGVDLHRFADEPDASRPLVLGGVVFPGERPLVGHSDADAIAHAVADALLGAVGMPDIGQRYPDTDPKWAGADSMTLLADVVADLARQGWSVVNVDCNVVCETPKIAPRKDEIVARLSETVGAPVNVKGRRTEQMGAIGRGEGVMCLAVALVSRSS